MRPTACVLALIACLAPARGDGVAWFDGTLEQALERAGEEGQLLVVDCWATWCTYCHEMDREVWSNELLARGLSRFALAVKTEVDFTTGVGADIEQRYGIDGLPVVLFLEPREAREIARLSGYADAERVLAAAEAAYSLMAGEEPPGAGDGDPASLLALASRNVLAGEMAAGEEAARAAIAADPLCSEDVADDAALLLVELLDGRRAPDSRDTLEAAASVCGRADRAAELWSEWAALEARLSGPAAAGEILERKLALFPASAEALLEYAEWAAGSDPAGEVLERAMERAERAAQMLPHDPRPLAAAARLKIVAGDDARALELLERAIAIDPHDPELRELRLRLTMAALSEGG